MENFPLLCLLNVFPVFEMTHVFIGVLGGLTDCFFRKWGGIELSHSCICDSCTPL